MMPAPGSRIEGSRYSDSIQEKGNAFFALLSENLGFGVRLFVDVFQAINAVMRIYLGGCQATVAQQFLDGVKIGAGIGKMRSKGMP